MTLNIHDLKDAVRMFSKNTHLHFIFHSVKSGVQLSLGSDASKSPHTSCNLDLSVSLWLWPRAAFS